MSLRDLARNQPCQIRLSGICNFDPKTTVLAHYRLGDVSGMGLKSYDLLGAWACSACHEWVDTHHDETSECAHLEGVIRTQAKLVELGVLQVKGTREHKPARLSKIVPRRA